MKYDLPNLKYNFIDLDPFIGPQNIHYEKHHMTYATKLNEALDKYPNLSERTLEDLLADIDSIPEEVRLQVRNNGGGFINHNLFWDIMNPNQNKAINADKEFLSILNSTFGGFDKFKELFISSGMARFGSGWVWLVLNQDKKLEVYSTPNQDSPYMQNHIPLLGLDVWEHAYYLKFQNRRADYIEEWWNIIDWNRVGKIYSDSISK